MFPFKADPYNNGNMYDDESNVECRPFPEVKTPRYHARWGSGVVHYAVDHGERTLGTFVEKERARNAEQTVRSPQSLTRKRGGLSTEILPTSTGQEEPNC